VAHERLYALHTSPLDVWNQGIFTFGGQIIPVKITQETDLAGLVDSLI
jgi:hypothetical protein